VPAFFLWIRRYNPAMRLLPAIACALALAGTPATAQTISSDVMKILTRGSLSGMGENYDLTVGAVPEGFPAALLPSGAKPVAATVSPTTTTVVVEVSGSPASVQATHRKTVATAGWLNSSPMQRGFTTSTTIADQVCREFEHANLQYAPAATGSTYIRIGLNRDRRRRCVARPDSFFSDVNIPSLQHPEGVRATGAGANGGADSFSASTQIETSLRPDALADHYGRQLVAAGWRETARLSDDGFIVVRYVIPSSTPAAGEVIAGMLVITPLDKRVDLFLRVTRPSAGRMPGDVTTGLTIRR
jgi:hypothetical protein